MSDSSSTPQSTDTRGAAIRLAGYSFLILFFELAFIRYIPAYVRVFAFYLNFVLIATFLGMGVGLLRVDMADKLKWLALPTILFLFVAVKSFSNVVVQPPVDPDEPLWGVFFEMSPSVRTFGLLPTATLLFAACAAFFVPLGALMGKEFRKLPPLKAYSIDIAGSLLGILTFAMLSAFRTPPVVWFTIGAVVWIAFSLSDRRFAGALTTVLAAAVALTVWTAGSGVEYWSPYYRISVFPGRNMLSLHVNGSMHQWMINWDENVVSTDETVARIHNDYTRSWDAITNLDTVLVVGAGTGNDVTLLLQRGAKYVDAVEIDPVIADIARVAQWQEVYADPRVHLYIDDARSFLRKTDRQYDLIVFGTLDSQTLLSGMSSLRLDNYVYTVEAFEAAKDVLKPDGSLVTYHMSPRPYIGAKIYKSLEVAFGHPPKGLFEANHMLFNFTFVAGAAADRLEWEDATNDFGAGVELPRDNWPYLYLRRPVVPGHYLKALGAVLLISLIFVGTASRGQGLRRNFDWAMFFMGVGFLLVETKSVSEMSLLFGATWVVNVLVFSSILTVILIANMVVLLRPPRSVQPLFIGLWASLGLAYAVPIRTLLQFGDIGQWLLGGTIVALPVLFASFIFATLFRTRVNSTGALASNLLGAIVGGVLEYGSLMLGFKALYLVAAVAYVGAWAAFRWHRSTAPVHSPIAAPEPVAVEVG